MRIKGQKITIVQGDSFDIPFVLTNIDGDDVVSVFSPDDTIVFVIQESGGCRDLIRKEVTNINGAEFNVYVPREESAKLCCGAYEYGVYLVNGSNRLTLIKPTSFVVERGV